MIIHKNPATQGGAATVAIVPTAPKPPVIASTIPAMPRPPMPAPVVQTPVASVSTPVIPTRPAPAPTQAVIPAPAAPARSLATSRSAAPALPSFVEAAPEGQVPAGFENAGSEAFRLPMLSVAQAQSPQVVEGKMIAGDVYLTTNRDAAFFGRGMAVPVLPFYYYKSWDRWNHRDAGGGLIDSSFDAAGANAKMAARQLREYRLNPQPTAQQQPERCFESLVWLALFKDQDETGHVTYVPVAIPFSKSKYKKGAYWLQLANAASKGKYPVYCATYLLKTVLETNKRGAFYNFDVDFAPPEELSEADYHAAKQANAEFSAMFEQRKLQVALEDDGAPDIEVTEATVKVPEGV